MNDLEEQTADETRMRQGFAAWRDTDFVRQLVVTAKLGPRSPYRRCQFYARSVRLLAELKAAAKLRVPFALEELDALGPCAVWGRRKAFVSVPAIDVETGWAETHESFLAYLEGIAGDAVDVVDYGLAFAYSRGDGADYLVYWLCLAARVEL